MDVLNQNKRRSAIGRLWGLGMIILALVTMSVIFMHETYADKGTEDLIVLEKKHQLEKQADSDKEKSLKSQNKLLKDNVATLKREIKEKDRRLKELEGDLGRCMTALAAKPQPILVPSGN